MGALKLEDLAYTYEDYKRWEGDWELYGGVPVAMSPAPLKKHQSLASEFIYNFRDALAQCPDCEVLGEVDYKIADDTILRPDIALTCNEENEVHLVKAPEIIVEIISPSTAKRDEKYKFEIYEAQKVKYYILVYPDDLYAKVYKLKESKYDKEGDFSSEIYSFEETKCQVELDFQKVFKRFRK